MMIKVVMLFKRKEGISREEFRDYYENNHAKLFEPYLRHPGVKRYVRRYLTPMPDQISGEFRDSGFDVITEVWVEQDFFDLYYSESLDPEFRALIAEDEEKFLDRPQMFKHTVEEFDTDLAQLAR
jgi:hypothetical protein